MYLNTEVKAATAETTMDDAIHILDEGSRGPRVGPTSFVGAVEE